MPSAPMAAPAQLVVRVAFRDVDLVSGLLWIDEPMGIEERVADGDETVLVAGFASRQEAAEAAGRLVERAGDVAPRTEVVDAVDESWRDAWRPYARPVRVGRVVVVPIGPGDDEPAAVTGVGDADVVLAVDPGRAFSAGSHPTTRLLLAEVLAALDGPDPPATVLDVGCGSGVLSVASGRLGAERVTAIDIDPAAIEATAANADRNGVAECVEVSATPLAELPGRYDLVLANLLAPTIVELARPLTAHVADGGRLVVSGLLTEHWVSTVFHLDRWYAEAVTTEDGWVAVRLSR